MASKSISQLTSLLSFLSYTYSEWEQNDIKNHILIIIIMSLINTTTILTSAQVGFTHKKEKCWNGQKLYSFCSYIPHRNRLWLCALLLRLIKIKTFILVWYLRLGEWSEVREKRQERNSGVEMKFLFHAFFLSCCCFLVFILCTGKKYTQKEEVEEIIQQQQPLTHSPSLSLSLTHIIYSTQDFLSCFDSRFWVGFVECSYSLGDMVV